MKPLAKPLFHRAVWHLISNTVYKILPVDVYTARPVDDIDDVGKGVHDDITKVP